MISGNGGRPKGPRRRRSSSLHAAISQPRPSMGAWVYAEIGTEFFRYKRLPAAARLSSRVAGGRARRREAPWR